MRLLQVCLLLLLCQQANALNKQLHALIAAPRPVAASACQPIAAPTIPAPAAPQAIPAQYLTDAPAITTTRDAGNSPTRYNAAAAWRRLQTAAAQADGRAAQQKLLKQGFTAQIYELTRKTWRGQAFQWNRQPSERELQAFLAVINQ